MYHFILNTVCTRERYFSLELCSTNITKLWTLGQFRRANLHVHVATCCHLSSKKAEAYVQFTPPASQDKTVLSVSCLAWRCKLDNCY